MTASRSENDAGWLRVGSAAYLAIPLVVFAFGWIRAPYSWLLAGTVGLLVADVSRRSGRFRLPGMDLVFRSWPSLVGIALFVLGVMAASGTGGFGFANFDHDKHSAMLADLIRSPWPVRFAEMGDRPLVFYLGWYLVPALAGKAYGWLTANLVLWVWTVIGFALACSWFLRITGDLEGAGWRLAVFLLMSGWDVVGAALLGSVPSPGRHLEQWGGFALTDMSYQSPTTVLFWVPHQGIAAWILTGWLLDGGLARRGARDLPALLALATLWTPWACVGLLPFAAWAAARERSWLPTFTNWMWIPAGVVAATIGIYYLAKTADPTAGWTLAPLAGCFGTGVAVGFYLLFLTLEVLPLALLASFAVYAEPSRYSSLATVAVSSLVLIPLVRAGAYNDFTMRASIPALYVLCMLGLCSAGRLREWSSLRVVAAIALLAPGLFTPGYEWQRGWSQAGFSYSTPRAGHVLGLSKWHYARQYVGRPGSIYDSVVAAPGTTPR